MIKKSKYYKGKVKFRIGNLETAIKRYNTYLDKTKYSDYIADMNDLFQDRVAHDMMIAENTVINYLKKTGAPEPDLLGRIAVCDILASEACHTVDDNIKEHGPKFPIIRNFKRIRATDITDAMICMSHSFEDEMWRIRHYNINLMKVDQISLAFQIIRNKLNDPNVILDIIVEYDKQQSA